MTTTASPYASPPASRPLEGRFLSSSCALGAIDRPRGLPLFRLLPTGRIGSSIASSGAATIGSRTTAAAMWSASSGAATATGTGSACCCVATAAGTGSACSCVATAAGTGSASFCVATAAGKGWASGSLANGDCY